MLRKFWIIIFSLYFPSSVVASEVLQFCYDPYPPYTMGGEGLAQGGLKAELLDAVVSRIDGLDAVVTLLPWKRCQSLTKSGEFDGILPLFRNPEREAYLAFTEGTFNEQSLLFYRKEQFSTTYEWSGDFAEFSGLKLGMLTGSYVDEAMESFFEKDSGITRSRDVQKLFELLIQERVDLVATDGAVGRFIIAKNGWDDKAVAAKQPVRSRYSYFGLSKASGASKHLESFNRAIAELQANGDVDDILAGDF